MIEFMALAATCAPAVHHSTLAAVVLQESGGNPFAIGVNRGAPRLAKQPTSRAEAVKVARQLQAAGHNFDAGLAQINVANWQWLGLTADTVFDPCTNLAAAQRVLADCYQRAAPNQSSEEATLYAALSCYNTGHFQRGLQNGYVQKVAAQAGVTVPGLSATPGPSRQTSPKRGMPDVFGSDRVEGAFHQGILQSGALGDSASLDAPPSLAPPYRDGKIEAHRPDALDRIPDG